MSLSEEQERVKQAIANMKNGEMNDYYQQTLKSRSDLSGEGQGSTYPLSPNDIEKNLINADWQPYEHEAIMEGCTAFIAKLSGRKGLTELHKVANQTEVLLVDPKKTGNYSALVKDVEREEVDSTIIILGAHNDEEVVFTFHPGEPVTPSQIKNNDNKFLVSAFDAIEKGFDLAKVADKKEWENAVANLPQEEAFNILLRDNKANNLLASIEKVYNIIVAAQLKQAGVYTEGIVEEIRARGKMPKIEIEHRSSSNYQPSTHGATHTYNIRIGNLPIGTVTESTHHDGGEVPPSCRFDNNIFPPGFIDKAISDAIIIDVFKQGQTTQSNKL